MGVLFYGSFEKVLKQHCRPKTTLKELDRELVPAAYTPKDRDDIGDSYLDYVVAVRGRTRNFTKEQLKPYENAETAREIVIRHFYRKEFQDIIPNNRRKDLKAALLTLIESDNDISGARKKEFARTAAKDTLEVFLADVFIYAIMRNGISTAQVKHPKETLPFGENKFFVGRDTQLQRIRDAFKAGKSMLLTQVITGLGGVGKTQLAAKYAYMYKKKYTHICWVAADNDNAIQASLGDFLLLIEDPAAEASNDARRVAFLKWLNGYDDGSWLLIFDNVNDFNDIRPYLPKNKNAKGDILITTRLQRGFEDITDEDKIDINVFDEAEAIAFLLRRTGLEDCEEARELARRLGYLPLALEQAGAYIAVSDDEKMSFQKYLTLYEQFGLDVFDKNERLGAYQESVTTTWLISMDAMEESARQLLSMCAYLLPWDIPVSLFRVFHEFLPEPLCSNMRNELAEFKVVRELTKYSLVRRYKDSITIHRLLHRVIFRNAMNEGKALYDCLNLFRAVCAIGIYVTNFELLVDHICMTVTFVECLPKTTELMECLTVIYYALADHCYIARDYPQAIHFCRLILDCCDEIGAQNSAAAYSAHYQLALIFSQQEEYDAALTHSLTAIELAESLYSDEKIRITHSYDITAEVLFYMGEKEEALKWLLKSLEIQKRVWGENHKRTLSAQYNIAKIYKAIGQVQMADELIKNIQELWSANQDDSPEEEEYIYAEYAILCQELGYLEESLEWLYKCLDCRIETYGSNHPSTTNIYEHIAVVCMVHGDYHKAYEAWQIVLENRRATLGKSHEQTIMAADKLRDCEAHIAAGTSAPPRPASAE